MEDARHGSALDSEYLRQLVESTSASVMVRKALEESYLGYQGYLREEFEQVRQSVMGNQEAWRSEHQLLHQAAREEHERTLTENLNITGELAFLRERMAASLQPLPDLHDLMRAEVMQSSFGRLSDAVSKAIFIAEVDFGDSPEDGDEADEIQLAEEKMVVLASPETISHLRSVEFVPLTLLDKIVRDPDAMRMLGAREFEQFVATLIGKLGFESIVLTPSSGDGGRDILATKRVNGIPIMFAFECKKYAPDRPVGPEIVRALLGTIRHPATPATMGVVVTTSTFSPAARKFIVTESALDGKDFDGVVDWLKEYGSRSSQR